MSPKEYLGRLELWAPVCETVFFHSSKNIELPNYKAFGTAFASRPVRRAQINIVAQIICPPSDTSIFLWDLGPETKQTTHS